MLLCWVLFVEFCYVECCYAEFLSCGVSHLSPLCWLSCAECHCPEFHYAECGGVLRSGLAKGLIKGFTWCQSKLCLRRRVLQAVLNWGYLPIWQAPKNWKQFKFQKVIDIRLEYIRRLCNKITVLSCHRCLIITSVEKTNSM